jgi:hypothetical protein
MKDKGTDEEVTDEEIKDEEWKTCAKITDEDGIIKCKKKTHWHSVTGSFKLKIFNEICTS